VGSIHQWELDGREQPARLATPVNVTATPATLPRMESCYQVEAEAQTEVSEMKVKANLFKFAIDLGSLVKVVTHQRDQDWLRLVLNSFSRRALPFSSQKGPGLSHRCIT
jgi:hypothetical protein